MLGGFHKVALLFCDHPRGTPQDKFSAEDAPFYRISGRVQVLKTVACNKELCIIPDPLQKKGSACLGRRKRVEVQNVVVQGGGWIIKGLFGWALVLSAVGVWGPFAPTSDTFTLVIKLAASILLLIAGSGLLFARKDLHT